MKFVEEPTICTKQMTILLVLGVILIGSNLRAPLTAVGSLIVQIQGDLAISSALAGAITTIPLLAFAFLSPFAPKLANRFGMEHAIFYAMIALTAGIVIRSIPSVPLLFAGTLLIGLAIAIGNVLIPAFIKMRFPAKIGVMTGVYAVFMNVFGALASGISVPLANWKGFGWQGALGAWAILSFIAILIWLPQLKAKDELNIDAKQTKSSSMWRSKIAWSVTLFMGTQSLLFYTLMTWLPSLLQQHHYSAEKAGWMLFLMQFTIVPFTFIVPIIAGKMKDQRLLSVITALFFAVGIVGLLSNNSALIPLWVILIGIGSGSAFSLSMMFFTLRTTTVRQASELSGMAQSFGYLVAATGPVLFGKLYDVFGAWDAPLYLLLGCSAFLVLVGWQASRDRLIPQ